MSEGLWPGTSCGGWWHRRWVMWKQRQHRISTHFRREQAQNALHALKLLTEENPRATVLSIDGNGAFDFISRKSMLETLMRVEGGPAIMPFVRVFYGQPSSYLWEGDDGTVHHVEQGEGGEQSDPLIPLLFAFGQHAALCAIDNSLGADDRLMAFLDDGHTLSLSQRACGTATGACSRSCGHIPGSASHEGKTQVWNSGGERPEF